MSKATGYKLSKDIVDSKGRPPKINTLEQFLVWKFLRNTPKTSLDWSREIKTAGLLLKNFPTVDFWNFVDLEFKLNSLLWFTTEKGSLFLNETKRRKEFMENTNIFNPKKQIEILEKPIENGYTNKEQIKPKTLMDFLNKK